MNPGPVCSLHASPAQLMYAFRIQGKDKTYIEIPEAKGKWKLVLVSAKKTKIKKSGDGFILNMPPNGAAIWKRL